MISWILDGCEYMQWAGNGYGIEIKDVPAVSSFHLQHFLLPLSPLLPAMSTGVSSSIIHSLPTHELLLLLSASPAFPLSIPTAHFW